MHRGTPRQGRAFLPLLIAACALAVAAVPFHSPSEAQSSDARHPLQHAVDAASSGNLTVAVGCVSSSLPTDLIFSAQPAANGALTRPLQQLPPTNSPAAVAVGSTGTVSVNLFDLGNPYRPLECGAVVQDSPPDIDANPNTVDTGSLTYTLGTLGGRFAILNTGTAVDTIACRQTTGGVAGFEGCTGGEYTTGANVVTPNPAFVISVGLAPGVPLSSLGMLSPIAGSNSGLALTATYTRDPSLSANPAAVPPGPESASSAVVIGIVAPSYLLTLTAAPATIPASPQFVTPTAPAAGIAGQGSVLTATLASYSTTAVGAVVLGSPPTTTTAGAEPGTVTFTTNLGVFGDQPLPYAAGKQTVAVACGSAPGSVPVYNPATFSFQPFAFNSCQTATATLYGGGQAGQATVVASFQGNITGALTQAAVLVQLSATPSVIALTRGCNRVTTPVSLAPNTPPSTYVYNYVSPSSSVTAVWQYNNAAQAFQALYFTVGGAPTVSNPSVGPGQSLFVCLSSPTTVIVASPSPTPNVTLFPSASTIAR